MDAGGFAGMAVLGGSIKVRVLTRDSNGTPTAPGAAPTAKVFGPGGQVGTTVTSGQVGSETGLYEITLTTSVGNGYAAGQLYHVVWSYSVGGTARGIVHTFQVC